MSMQRLLPCLAVVGATAVLALPAAAQTSGTSSAARAPGWLPGAGTGTGYVGLNVGRSRYHAACGVRDVFRNLDLECGLHDVSYHLYAGSGLGAIGSTSGTFGGEVGYVDMGHIARAGGETRARGINLSLVGRMPVAGGFGVFGKVGTTYGWTRTSSVAGSGVTPGKEQGFGLSYGVGASYDFTPNLSGVVAWDSHDFRFAGSGRDPIRVTSVGLQYRY